jgi:putative transposase
MITFLSALVSLLSFRIRSRASLELELLALRHQVIVLRRRRPRRLRLFLADRLFWVWVYRLRPQLLNTLVLVKPATVIGWHRKGLRVYWRWRSGDSGRPRTNPQIRELIRRMSAANPFWGAPRIHGELLKLGIEVSQATVGRYLPWRPKDPSPTWRSFLHNHLADTVAIDMFIVATATFRVLYTLIALDHYRRKIIHFGVTENPTQVGFPSRLPTPFPGTPHLGFCCEIETRRTVRFSVAGLRVWASRRSLLLRGRPGRIHLSNVLSAQSAVNVWITSSSSTSVICGACYPATFNIIMRLEPIFP